MLRKSDFFREQQKIVQTFFSPGNVGRRWRKGFLIIKMWTFYILRTFPFWTLFVEIFSLLMELGVSFEVTPPRASEIKFNNVLQFDMRMYRNSSNRKKNSAEGFEDGKLVFWWLILKSLHWITTAWRNSNLIRYVEGCQLVDVKHIFYFHRRSFSWMVCNDNNTHKDGVDNNSVCGHSTARLD